MLPRASVTVASVSSLGNGPNFIKSPDGTCRDLQQGWIQGSAATGSQNRSSDGSWSTLVSVPPLGALRKTKPLTGAGIFHHPEACPRSTAPTGLTRRPRQHGYRRDAFPPWVPDVAIFARAMGCCGSKDIGVPLPHGAAGICLCLSLTARSEEKKKARKKSDRVLRPSDKERSAPVTGFSLSASQGLASVPRPNVCAPSGPHGTAPWARPSTWDSRLVVGQFRALGARPPHPCPRAKSCRVPSPSLAPRPNRRPLSCPCGECDVSCPRKRKRRDQTRALRADMPRVVRDET